MNNKLILGAGAALLATAVGVGPIIIGQQAEQQLQAHHQLTNSLLSDTGVMSVTLENYQRSWGGATAQSILTIDLNKMSGGTVADLDPEQPLPENIKVVLNHTISHGPLILTAGPMLAMAYTETTIHIPEKYSEIVEHYFAKHPPYQQQTTLSLLGGAHSTFTIPSYQGLSHDGSFEIDWQGVNGKAEGDILHFAGDYSMTAPLLKLTNEEMSISMINIDAKTHSEGVKYGQLLGNSSVSMAELRVTGNEASQNLSLQQLSLSLNTSLASELINYTQNLSFASLTADELFQVGPGEMEFSLRNLNGEILEQLQRDIGNLSIDPTLPPEQAGIAFSMLLMPHMEKLLSHSPEMEIRNAKLATEQGEISSRLLFGFNGSQPFDMQGAPFSLIPHLQIEFDLAMPIVLAKMLAQNSVDQQLRMTLLNLEPEQQPTEEEYQ